MPHICATAASAYYRVRLTWTNVDSRLVLTLEATRTTAGPVETPVTLAICATWVNACRHVHLVWSRVNRRASIHGKTLKIAGVAGPSASRAKSVWVGNVFHPAGRASRYVGKLAAPQTKYVYITSVSLTSAGLPILDRATNNLMQRLCV